MQIMCKNGTKFNRLALQNMMESSVRNHISKDMLFEDDMFFHTEDETDAIFSGGATELECKV